MDPTPVSIDLGESAGVLLIAYAIHMLVLYVTIAAAVRGALRADRADRTVPPGPILVVDRDERHRRG